MWAGAYRDPCGTLVRWRHRSDTILKCKIAASTFRMDLAKSCTYRWRNKTCESNRLQQSKKSWTASLAWQSSHPTRVLHTVGRETEKPPDGRCLNTLRCKVAEHLGVSDMGPVSFGSGCSFPFGASLFATWAQAGSNPGAKASARVANCAQDGHVVSNSIAWRSPHGRLSPG